MKELPSIQEIQRALRMLEDYTQRPVYGIDVVRWPGWGKWCYEVESYGGRPGLSEIVAAKIIRRMLDGATYHQAFAEVTGKTIKPRAVKKTSKNPNRKGFCKCR